MFNIEWKTGIGYGDFVTGLGYAHNACLKYLTPVNITFHWNHAKNFLFSDIDTETIVERCDYIYSVMQQNPLVSVTHKYNSCPNFRFINQLDEHHRVHGIWHSRLEPIESNIVVLWTSRHNIEPPPNYKDPAKKHWDLIEKKLKENGYDVIEVTYRTPVREVVDLINRCAFGIGYDGLAHQLFKFMWKPCIVLCERLLLNELLIPQAALEKDPQKFLDTNLNYYLNKSSKKIEFFKKQHEVYINSYVNPYEHELYNTPIG